MLCDRMGSNKEKVVFKALFCFTSYPFNVMSECLISDPTVTSHDKCSASQTDSTQRAETAVSRVHTLRK